MTEIESRGRVVLVGLGNPGPEYDGTRHNIGFSVVDKFASSFVSSLGQFKVERYGLAVLNISSNIHILKPLTYMNRSGEPIQEWLRQKNGKANLLVLHDEVEIPVGETRLKIGGGEAGHNGLKSISNCFGTKDYARLRLGVGKPSGWTSGDNISSWVLGRFRSEENILIDRMKDRATEALLSVVKSFEKEDKDFDSILKNLQNTVNFNKLVAK